MGVIVLFKKSLPENAQIPSVYGFAECQTTGTRQRRALPSARPRALGKYVAHSMPTLYRMLAVGKERHSAYPHFAECQKASTRQRQVTCPARVPAVRRPLSFAECWKDGTRQSVNFAEYLWPALGKASFAEWHPPGTRQIVSIFIFISVQIFL